MKRRAKIDVTIRAWLFKIKFKVIIFIETIKKRIIKYRLNWSWIGWYSIIKINTKFIIIAAKVNIFLIEIRYSIKLIIIIIIITRIIVIIIIIDKLVIIIIRILKIKFLKIK